MSDLVDITVHINENIDPHDRQSIQEEIRQIDGVMVASSSDAKPHLLMFGYDPKRISGQEIVNAILNKGMHAQMITL